MRDFNYLMKPVLIAGPCALESDEITRTVAAKLRVLAEEFGTEIIFKGSYSKANRTRDNSYHGIGLERGLEMLLMVRQEYGLRVTSDVHTVTEMEHAAEVLDIIQIPALLCKNTDILHAAADTGKPVNIKKGHFITASDMGFSIDKVAGRGNDQIYITERGTLFGYSDTIVDFRSIETLKSFGFPVIFDASHSVRRTSCRSEDPSGGTPESIELLTRCAAAAQSDGLFIEAHPFPIESPCDAISSYPLDQLGSLFRLFTDLRTFVLQQEETRMKALRRKAG